VTSDFPHQSHGTVVWDSCSTLSGVRLGGCHPLWRAFSGHFSFASEEEAGPLTLHLPRFSTWDSVWTFPVSLAATRGIPFWFLFLPLLRCFRSGGCRSFRSTAIPKNRDGRSHSGIPGSKAACAYPGRFRGLPRPSSVLKPSHSPDSVACSGLIGVCLSLVKPYILCCCVCLCVVSLSLK
jgi:hypothetical protein